MDTRAKSEVLFSTLVIAAMDIGMPALAYKEVGTYRAQVKHDDQVSQALSDIKTTKKVMLEFGYTGETRLVDTDSINAVTDRMITEQRQKIAEAEKMPLVDNFTGLPAALVVMLAGMYVTDTMSRPLQEFVSTAADVVVAGQNQVTKAVLGVRNALPKMPKLALPSFGFKGHVNPPAP